jgi:hypothetical protein
MTQRGSSKEFELLSTICFAIGWENHIAGTGFFFARDGMALTARHVVDGFLHDAIPVFYHGQSYQASIVRESREHDIAVIVVAGAEVVKLIGLASLNKWHRDVIVAGYQQQEVFPGLNPLDLSIESLRPLRHVVFPDGGTQECLTLIPRNHNYRIKAGTSGGPVMDRKTYRIIGVVIGTMQQRIIGEIEQNDFGFAIPLDTLFSGWKPFRTYLDSVLEYLPPEESDLPLDVPELTAPPIDRFTLQPVPPANPQFEMAIYLVTDQQFKVFVDANSEWRPADLCLAEGNVDDNYLMHWKSKPVIDSHFPVVNVSAYAAEAYLTWLGNQHREIFRLPTPVEWEIAARAGRGGENWAQEHIEAERVNFERWGRTVVNDFLPNEYGIHDLLGNVYDLCSIENGTFSALGGAFNSTKGQLIKEKPIEPSECFPNVGFRLVRDLRNIKEEKHA